MYVKKIIKLIRVKHWVKNLLLFFPIFFAGKLFDTDALLKVVIGFFSISFIASAGYIFNNILDKEEDKENPAKRIKNPLAHEEISLFLAILLIFIFIFLGYFLGVKINIGFCVVLTCYLINTVLYSLIFKHIFILDLLTISLGFIFRLFLGGIAADIKISGWLIILVFCVSLILGAGKRLEELEQKNCQKKVLKKYNKNHLQIFILFLIAITWISFIIYLLKRNYFNIILAFLSLFLLLNYYYSITFKKRGEPTDFLLSNKWNFLMLLIWFIVFFYKVYM